MSLPHRVSETSPGRPPQNMTDAAARGIFEKQPHHDKIVGDEDIFSLKQGGHRYVRNFGLYRKQAGRADPTGWTGEAGIVREAVTLTAGNAREGFLGHYLVFGWHISHLP